MDKLREIAQEIMDEAFDDWAFDKADKAYKGTFDIEACVEVLNKYFPDVDR